MPSVEELGWGRTPQGRIALDGEPIEPIKDIYDQTLADFAPAKGDTKTAPVPSAELPPATMAAPAELPQATATPAISRQYAIPNSAIGFIALVVLLLGIGLAVWRSNRLPPATAAAPTALPRSAMAAPTATSAPRLIDAYAAPGGDVIGPIDANTIRYRILARSGADWMQVDAGGTTGRVWFRRQDLPLDQVDLAELTAAPDLATPTAAPRPTDPPAPTSGPAPPCDPDTAPYRVERPVVGAGGWPLGQVSGVSCVSQAEAEANADQWEQQLRAGATATAASRPPAPDLP
jgi:hypothetical protein